MILKMGRDNFVRKAKDLNPKMVENILRERIKDIEDNASKFDPCYKDSIEEIRLLNITLLKILNGETIH